MQNTNSGALIRLRPLENNDIGAIVEEHIRYWKESKDAEEARKLAQKAKQQEFNRKVAKDAFDLYDGIQPEENAGFLNSQIINTFDKNKEYYTALAKASASGDVNASMKLAEEKRKIETAVNVNKVYAKKMQELQAQKAEGVFNEYLDSDAEAFMNSILKGKYKLNPDWSLNIYNPALEGKIIDGTTGVPSDGLVRLTTSSLLNNDFLNRSYSKKAQFVENGKDIAQNLLDTEDGNQEIKPNTEIEGIKLVRSLFAQDDVEKRSWYGNAVQQGLVSFNEPYDDLDEVQKNQLAKSYYDNNVLPNIQENVTDNTTKDALEQQRLTNARLEAQKKRQAIKKGKKELETVDLSLATTEDGQKIKADLRKGDQTDFADAVKEGTILNIVGSATRRDVKDEKETSVTYTHVIRNDKTGDLVVIGKYNEKTPILDEDGEKTGKFEESTQLRVVRNDTELNVLSSMFDGVTNLKELSDKVKSVKGVVSEDASAEGDSIFEN